MCFCSNERPTLILSDGSSLEDELASRTGWNKPRMWSEYGQDHYGVCLVFSKAALDTTLIETQAQTGICYKADYVKYMQEDQTAWKEIDVGRLQEEGVEAYSLRYIKENFEELFFRKQIDYRDESEYRVVVVDTEKRLEFIDIDAALKGVIVGDRTADAYVPLINQMCDALEIESRSSYGGASPTLRGGLRTCELATGGRL